MSESTSGIQAMSAAVVAGNATVSQLKATSSEGAQDEENTSQDVTPTDDASPVNDDDTGAQAPAPVEDPVDPFEKAYGHLSGHARKQAEKVFAAQQRHQSEVDAQNARGFIGDGEYADAEDFESEEV